MSELLIANTSAVCRVDGKRRVIKAKQTMVRSDDPIVKGRESLFRPVETATAAPGERRSVGRPRKKVAQKPPESEPKASTEGSDESDTD